MKAYVDHVGKKHGRIDICSHNAGNGFYTGEFLDMEEKGYDKMMDVNTKSAYFFVKFCMPYLMKSKYASIVIMTSLVAFEANHLLGMYNPAKLAVVSIIKCIS